jgi:hypothetical protein
MHLISQITKITGWQETHNTYMKMHFIVPEDAIDPIDAFFTPGSIIYWILVFDFIQKLNSWAESS